MSGELTRSLDSLIEQKVIQGWRVIDSHLTWVPPTLTIKITPIVAVDKINLPITISKQGD